MEYGVKPLRRIQLFREATPGTPGAATVIWRGPANIVEDTREVVEVEEDTGQLTPSDRTYIPQLSAQMAWESTPATYQQILHIFEGGINEETATQDGAGTDYIWEYVIGESTNDVKTYTIEGGDNVDVGEMEYSFVQEFVLSGNFGESVMLESATWIGRQYTDTSFTGALSLETVEEILFNKGKIYIDADGGSFGGTQKTGTLTGFRLTVDTGWRAVPVGDGNLYFASIKNVGPRATLEIIMEHEDTAAAERANWRDEVVRKIRLEFEGSAVATPGTTYSNYTMLIDVRGKWETFSIFDDADGDNIVTGTLIGRDDSTTAESKITVVNETASL